MADWITRRPAMWRVAVVVAALAVLVPVAAAIAATAPAAAGHWSLDDGVGAVALDSTTGDRDGTVTGATWVPGNIGTALRFDGSGDRLDIGGAAFEPPSISVGLWVRATPGQAPAPGAVIFELGAHACEGTIGLYATADGVELRAHGTANTVARSLVLDESWYGTDPWDGSWHHIAASVAAFGTMQVTIDARAAAIGTPGAIDHVGADASGIAIGAPLRPGQCATPSFKGEIDDIRLFDAALDRDQIGSLMPPVATSVSVQQVEPIRARVYGDCLQVTVTPPPPGGTVKVQVRDAQGTLVKEEIARTEWCAWPAPAPPEGIFLVPLGIDWAGPHTATAFFEPGHPLTSATSEPFAFTVERRSTRTTINVNPVMPNHGIVVETGVEHIEAGVTGTMTLVETTGGTEKVLGTKAVVPSPGSTLVTASFTLAGRAAATYTFEARYSGTDTLYQASAASTSVEIDDTLGWRGPVTLGATHINDSIVSVHAPAEHAVSMRVRLPGRPWFEQSYFVPGQYPLGGWGPIPPDGPIAIEVQWQDSGGRWSETHTGTAILDRTAPIIISPTSALSTTTPGLASVPTRLSWSSSDATAGVVRHEVQASRNGGAYATVSTTLSTPTVTRPLSSGSTYRFRIRTVDRAGNTSAWKTTASMVATQYQESSSRIVYRGTWTRATASSYLGGAVKASSTRGATATFTFTGRSFAWVAAKGRTRGSADVYVNGTFVKTVSLYATSTTVKQVVFAKTWAGAAKRTVVIKVRGTTGHPRVDIDALQVLN